VVCALRWERHNKVATITIFTADTLLDAAYSDLF
jgi:hypothetical protein